MSVYVDDSSAFGRSLAAVRSGADSLAEAGKLYDQLTDDERLALLDGDTPFWEGMLSFVRDGYNVDPYVHGEIDRLGIPGTHFIDGPRGCVRGKATAFPVSMARGATWDEDLEERVGVAIGEEIREQGGNFFGGVCINLPRHPAWGRAQETYSDQPVILGRMGAALSRGVQHNAMACMKHFACNSMENARFSVDVNVDEATFHEVYLPHFKHVADSGVHAVMSSYNSINGEWGGENHYDLTQVLRDDWGFKGLAVSDFIWGLRDAAKSVRNGLDIEEPFTQQRGEHLKAALESGEVSWDDVKRSGLRILDNQLRYYAERWTEEPKGTVASKAHMALAREVESRAVVMLKNDPVEDVASAKPVLPIDPETGGHIAVFGRLADMANTGDHGSSDVHSPYVVTPLQGIREAFAKAEVEYVPGNDDGSDESATVQAARGSDIAIVVVGYTAADEGEFVDGSIADREDLLALYPDAKDDDQEAMRKEVLERMGGGASIVGTETAGGDRRDLHLHAEDVALIRRVAAANPRTVVIVVSAGAVLMEEWQAEVPALLLGWYSGSEGGHGLADVLSGKANPSGRLPYPIPASAADLPELDIDATEITYDRYYGQRLIQHNGSEALFPLGFGLSYTDWRISDVAVRSVDAETGVGQVETTVTNAGGRDGYHVVQVYGTVEEGDRAGERELLGFAVASVPAGDQRNVVVDLDLTAFGRWNPETRKVESPRGRVRFEASSYWGDPAASATEVTL
ncbi:glycoside hydrolase family 3 protein [Bifidobacterium simiarum]|uniref:glycoside hydrolase family 3 protein n=1 Tax=Bifidobacterium simiarum TaxID=2045441 RepID=UPI001BDD2600|nr:glycoside hydrolase family 3 C-terminal domain-containing protein [Bifidobacterium simiarum]MBT1167077.1 glycoside hydrolase family 3 C-terminal domain-containing protein [Bifidobacterium simiarum]